MENNAKILPGSDIANLFRFFYQVSTLSAVLAILFGLSLIFLPWLSVTALLYIFAGYSIITGIMHITGVIRYITDRKERYFFFAAYGLSILLGVVVLFIPTITAVVLMYLLAGWFVFKGSVELISSIKYRKRLRSPLFIIVVECLSILFGILLFLWPKTGAVAIAWVLGLVFIVWGGSFIINAYYLKRNSRAE